MSPARTATPPAIKRTRVPASERRDALIDSAVHEFARDGLHGTPVDRIARSVGVAQPYVFALFGSKRELFLAAVERGFQVTGDTFTAAAEAYDPDADPDIDVLKAMGMAYRQLLNEQRDYLMLQHQSYAACDDPVIRDRVRQLFAALITRVQKLAGPDSEERVDEFFRYGMWLNVAAAMGVEDLSAGCDWVREEARQSGGLRSG
jgi:AcrR family transcriptional regulator